MLNITSFSLAEAFTKQTQFRRMCSQVAEVIHKDFGRRGLIILNRPKALNALNLSMVKILYPLLQKWESEKDVVVIKGAGGRAFCAGGDVRAIVQAAVAGDKEFGRSFFRNEYALNLLIGTYKIPYCAIIDGIVMGGGVGLSVHGRYRIATERSLFAMPEMQIGLFPDVGGSHFLPQLSHNVGTYLALTGSRLKGSDLFRAGIATHYCSSDKLETLENALLTRESVLPETILAEMCPINNIPEYTLNPHLKQIEHCFSANKVEDIIDRLTADGTKWAQDTIKTLLTVSPTSLKVALRQLQRSKAGKMSLADCLNMEYTMAYNFIAGHDFLEGVRALLIDKDQKPSWNPKTLPDVTDDLVDRHFRPIPIQQPQFQHKL